MRPLDKDRVLYKPDDNGLIEKAYYDRYKQAYENWANAAPGTEESPFSRGREWGEYTTARDTYLDFIYPDKPVYKKKLNSIENEKPFFNA